MGSITVDNEGAKFGGIGRRGLIVVLLVVLASLPVALWLASEGTLTLESNPSGATVVIDGRTAGVTPLTLSTRFSSLSGNAEIRLDGYQVYTLPFRVEPRQSGKVSAGLVAVAAVRSTLEVRSTPAGAQVLLDGTAVGVTPLVLDSVSPALHRVKVALANYGEWSQEVSLTAGQKAQVTAELVPVPAILSVTSTPADAKVRVDDKEMGATPARLQDLAPGEHVVKVSKAGYEDWVQTVQLSPGGSLDLQAALRRPQQSVATFNRPIAVMIDNHPDARPQSGLSAADVVYEALAEGGVTRFMGIFASRGAEVVGPVRSARHYFVYWADEYDAMYVHCGGYPEAYDAIKSTGIADFDDLLGSPGFWRGTSRPAPHNLYTSTAGLREAAPGRGYKKELGSYGGLLFEETEIAAEGKPAGRISIDYPHGYVVRWQYDPGSNEYARFHTGQPAVDANNSEQLRASNVVVMRAKNWFIGRDDQQDFEQVGSGQAMFFVDGTVNEGTWTRDALDKPTMFWNAAGERVQLNKGGTTWIQVVPLEAKVAFD